MIKFLDKRLQLLDERLDRTGVAKLLPACARGAAAMIQRAFTSEPRTTVAVKPGAAWRAVR